MGENSPNLVTLISSLPQNSRQAAFFHFFLQAGGRPFFLPLVDGILHRVDQASF
jgi:hypothetical protein